MGTASVLILIVHKRLDGLVFMIFGLVNLVSILIFFGTGIFTTGFDWMTDGSAGLFMKIYLVPFVAIMTFIIMVVKSSRFRTEHSLKELL
ncbi:MAG: hypothetical protein ACTSRU_20430 [Candidatus Hodarchaeales archaeon]